MLRVEALQTYYGDIQALDVDELHVDEGEIVALIGANGAGKSTLLRTISCQIKAKSGRIAFNGEDITRAKSEHVVSLGLIQVPEGRQIFPALTIRENLLMGAYLIRDRTRVAENIAMVYDLFPRLQEREKNLAQTLSGGEQQMLALGRALMSNPKLIMFDEPSLGIAPILVEDIFRVIRQLNEDGMAILLVEQNVLLSLDYSDRGYVIENGRIVISDRSDKLKSNSDVEKAYLGM